MLARYKKEERAVISVKANKIGEEAMKVKAALDKHERDLPPDVGLAPDNVEPGEKPIT